MVGMVDRMLKCARPGDPPIEVVTHHKLSINLRLAREIGVTIPPGGLARRGQRDEVSAQGMRMSRTQRTVLVTEELCWLGRSPAALWGSPDSLCSFNDLPPL